VQHGKFWICENHVVSDVGIGFEFDRQFVLCRTVVVESGFFIG
jgi:hypothetical protein